MELYQLRYFVAVAREGNFTRAAASLGISQPPLSQQVINLERELNTKLFHRLGRRTVLTEAGEFLLRRAEKILFDVENTTAQLGDDPKALRTNLAIGGIPTVAAYFLLPVMKRFREQHPNTQVHVYEHFTGDLARLVLAGTLDFALAAEPPNRRGLDIEKLHEEPLLVAMAADHALTKRKELMLKNLGEVPFILLDENSSLAFRIQAYLKENLFSPEVTSRVAQVTTVIDLVALGAGVSLLPRSIARAWPRDDLVYRELKGPAPQREVYLLRHPDRYQTYGARRLLEGVRAHAQHLAREAS